MPSLRPITLDGDLRSALPLRRAIAAGSSTHYDWADLSANISSSSAMASKSGGLGSYTSVNGTSILSEGEQRALQSVAFATSAISLVAAVVAIYWFCMMRRSFRRDLVLLLIAGGSWKSLWFFLFGAVEFSTGNVASNSAFCKVSGYMLEVGFESCDFAILFMSVHMCLQIFPPARMALANDGLYQIRHWIFALWVILPNLCAALAFINPVDPYTSVGGFCFLPIRPFWYRLALFWIPRYLIWIFIMYVAIRIYTHVGKDQFRIFGQEKDDSESLPIPAESEIEHAAQQEEQARMQREEKRKLAPYPELTGLDVEKQAGLELSTEGERRTTAADTDRTSPSQPLDTSPTSPRSEQQQAEPAWAGYSLGSADPGGLLGTSNSQANSRRGSHHIALGVLAEDFAPSPITPNTPTAHFLPNVDSIHSSFNDPSEGGSHGLAPIQESHPNSVNTSKTSASSAPRGLANRSMQERRRAILRQLRLLFIYPCVYMLIWIFPSIVHFMNYTTYFAQHPVFALTVIQTFCLTIMTFVDVFIFCWRERPWRHIPGSDASITGSFLFWRFVRKQEWRVDRRESRAPAPVPKLSLRGVSTAGSTTGAFSSQTGLLASLKRFSLSRKFSTPRSPSLATSPVVPHSFLPSQSQQDSQQRHTVSIPSHPSPPRGAKSSASDRKNLEARRAYERLALERADQATAARTGVARKRTSEVEGRGAAERTPIARTKGKEWFDREFDWGEDGRESEEIEHGSGSASGGEEKTLGGAGDAK